MNTTKKEKAYHNDVASLGCIACYLDGNMNSEVSIHHCDGRTKKGAHMKVLPLCAGHHQDGTGNDKTMIPIHPYKKRFETRYGLQSELMEIVNRMLNES
tara:strand:- start:571 stop:867 length:297 start_codon:yes stop_codon:yes gene_type:complete